MARRLLLAASPGNLAAFVRMGQLIQYPGCHRFAASLRAGRNLGLEALGGSGATLYARIAADPALEQVFHAGMSQFTVHSGEVLAASDVFDGRRHVVDIGGGDGTTAMALCARHPSLRVSVLDIATVANQTRRRIEALGIERIDVCAGDAFADPLPDDIDAVLCSHFLEIFSEAKVRAIYRRAFDGLSPSGRFVVWTLTCRDDETGPLQAAKSSIYFLSTASGEGMAYPVSDHVAWLHEAGFAHITSTAHGDHALIVSDKAR